MGLERLALLEIIYLSVLIFSDFRTPPLVCLISKSHSLALDAEKVGGVHPIGLVSHITTIGNGMPNIRKPAWK